MGGDTEPVLAWDDGPVRWIAWNRPERRNAVNLDDRLAWLNHFGEAEATNDCRAIVLSGCGGFFCAGGDIRTMPTDPGSATTRMQAASAVARALAGTSKPVIAAVEGGAFGMGLALATASDLVIAADDAKLGATFGRLGLTADTGISWSLTQRVGKARARQILLYSRIFSAQEAHSEGIVDLVVPAVDVASTAREQARTLAAAAPGTVRATKHLFTSADGDLDTLLELETRAQVELLGTEDFIEGRDAYLERRTPQFTGR